MLSITLFVEHSFIPQSTFRTNVSGVLFATEIANVMTYDETEDITDVDHDQNTVQRRYYH